MTREDRLKTHIRVGNLGIEPKIYLDPTRDGDGFDLVQWGKDVEGKEVNWVIASIEKDEECNPYLKGYGDNLIDSGIDGGELYSMMKLIFELEKM